MQNIYIRGKRFNPTTTGGLAREPGLPDVNSFRISLPTGYLMEFGRNCKPRSEVGSNRDRRKAISTFSTILLGIWLSVLPAAAKTITAASTSQADVAGAIASASTGDTVNIPAGTSTWTSAIAVTKSISIIGAGVGNTVLINSTSSGQGLEIPIFNLEPGDNNLMRVSAIYFRDSADAMTADGIDINPSTLPTSVMVDNCTFEGFSFAMKNQDGFGVCYDCTFLNNNTSMRNQGYYNTSALYGFTFTVPAWGTTQYFVWEDDTFTFTNWNGGKGGGNNMGDTEYPSNYMVRHCTFNINRASTVTTDGFDMHGSGNTQNPSSSATNNFGPVIHDNVWNYTGNVSVSPNKLADIRGGVGSLVYNNTGTGDDGQIEVRADPGASLEPTQTYFWNNTANRDVDSIDPEEGAVQGTNYFLFQPSNFSEMPYPHPLRTGGSIGVGTPTPTPGSTPVPPTGLHIVPGS